MTSFLKRTITGALFVTTMIACIWLSYWTTVFLFLLVCVLGLFEFYSLLEKADYSPQKYFGIAVGIFLFTSASMAFSKIIPEIGLSKTISISLPLLFTLFVFELFRKRGTPLQNIAITLLGLLYILIPFLVLLESSFLVHTPKESIPTYRPNIILGYFFLVWSNDTFAYLAGMLWGKHKLFERISPKKTWEGAIAGLALSLVVAYAISLFFVELGVIKWLAIAIIVCITGTLGDLVESMFKRSFNVKDSGNLLPGHGGILDRFDGVLLSSPFVFTYLLITC